MARNCKVIATCFTGRELRPEHDTCGSPPGVFLHAQVFPDADSVLELVRLNHEIEGTVDPGAACDTIIVNNDVGWQEGNRYLDSIDGTRTHSGVLRVVHRENFGTSLGAYNHAYQLFKQDYDYWTFTEDDILVNGHHWLRQCLDSFSRNADTGFVAIQGLSSDWALHAHGGVGTTHVNVLGEVERTWGALPHRQQEESQTDTDHTVFGEVLFTNLISRMGRRLVTVDAKKPLYTFAYDYLMQRRGLQVKHRRPKLLPRLLRRAAMLTDAWAERLA